MASIKKASPQFLVADLQKAISFYVDRLGFKSDFVYEGFYGTVSRDEASIHLKCAPKLEAERMHRKSGGHLDAFLAVSSVEELHEELKNRGAPIALRWGDGLGDWSTSIVEDLDGYILCFSQEGD
jgi:catechol 2,3-dioxygenase-like lactoylglutathione lyase family enzyme